LETLWWDRWPQGKQVKEKGQLVKKGSLGEDGDIEFWPDDQATQQGEGDGKKDNA